MLLSQLRANNDAVRIALNDDWESNDHTWNREKSSKVNNFDILN